MTQLILLPQVTQMLAKESYHYCADCKAHCRQLILAVEALKELNRAYTALLDSDSQAAGEVQCADCLTWFSPDTNHTCREQVQRNQRIRK